MAVNKLDPKIIFASEAPAQDVPAVFANKTVGWGESRKNGGRPTIKQSNALQQETDLKILWLNENAVTPYDATIDYPVNTVTLKDGTFKIFNGSVWNTFLTKSSVGLGNVDNTSDLNKPISTATQGELNNKASIASVNNLQNSINLKADLSVVKRGIGNIYDPTLTYNVNERVILLNGEIVQSTIANNTNNPNINMSGWTVDSVKNPVTTVESIVNLASIQSPKNGQTIFVKSHYANLLTGSGTYQFEQLSSKQDNGGTWIASTVSAGTWVLISENFIEHFGAISDGTDQSAKIQSALDFYLANNIRSFGFEKSKKYSVATPIRLKQYKVSISESYADPKLGTIFSFNGAYLEALTDNQKTIVVSRDNVQINNLVITTNKSGVVGVYNGLDIENNDLTLRRSSMRMVLNNPKFERLDIGMKFEPAETKNGDHWGSFYHCIYNPHAVATNIMFDFRQSLGDGGNSNTRNTIVGVKHVGGSCTIYGEALESSLFLGIESEFISRPDARLPDGEAVVLHLPFGTPSDFQANRGNRFTAFNIEVCTNYINVNAPDTHIDGFQQGATNPLVKAWIYNNTYANVSQVIGGSRMVAYNTTPRFGMVQINDNGVSNGFYVENLGIDKSYRISADNGISFGAMSLPSIVKSETSRLNIQKSSGEYSFYIDYTSAFFPVLGSTTGELGLAVSLIPTSETLTVGSAGNRLSKLFSNNANISGLGVYVDNASARASGLIVGEFYRTATGQVMVAF